MSYELQQNFRWNGVTYPDLAIIKEIPEGAKRKYSHIFKESKDAVNFPPEELTKALAEVKKAEAEMKKAQAGIEKAQAGIEKAQAGMNK